MAAVFTFVVFELSLPPVLGGGRRRRRLPPMKGEKSERARMERRKRRRFIASPSTPGSSKARAPENDGKRKGMKWVLAVLAVARLRRAQLACRLLAGRYCRLHFFRRLIIISD